MERQTAIDIIGLEQCTSCYGCDNACPHGAIDMTMTIGGFIKPVVNDACTNCKACQKFCPVIQGNDRSKFNLQEDLFYAAKSKNQATQLASSSGGIFTELSEAILDDGGVVVGVGWKEDLRLEHKIISTKEELALLRGSKYLQSEVGNVYKEIRKELRAGKKVLFSGVPCQVATMNLFVKDNPNLITVDVVCHGTPSYKPFEAYVKQEFGSKEVVDTVSFRDKETGWENFSVKYIKDGNVLKSEQAYYDSNFWGFVKDYYLNSACYDCKFAEERPGDITLGDFWGINRKLYDNKGVTVVKINTEKGKKLYDCLDIFSVVTTKEESTKQAGFKGAITNYPKESYQKIRKIMEKNSEFKFSDISPYIEFAKKPTFLQKVIRKIKNIVKVLILR